MARTNTDEVFDKNGNVIASTTRIVSDLDDLRDGAPLQLRNAYAGLRTWSVDAQANFDSWPTKTNAQKDAAQREVIRRFGVLCDRLADLLLYLNTDR